MVSKIWTGGREGLSTLCAARPQILDEPAAVAAAERMHHDRETEGALSHARQVCSTGSTSEGPHSVQEFMKGDILCKIDPRVCDGSGAAVNCDQNRFLRESEWLPLGSKYTNEAFISAAQFVCKF